MKTFVLSAIPPTVSAVKGSEENDYGTEQDRPIYK
jgi:hypothetical protein